MEENMTKEIHRHSLAVELFLVFIESGWSQLLWALAALQAPRVERCPEFRFEN